MERIMVLKRGETIKEIKEFPFDIEKGDIFLIAKTLFRVKAPENATINGYTDYGPIITRK